MEKFHLDQWTSLSTHFCWQTLSITLMAKFKSLSFYIFFYIMICRIVLFWWPTNYWNIENLHPKERRRKRKRDRERETAQCHIVLPLWNWKQGFSHYQISHRICPQKETKRSGSLNRHPDFSSATLWKAVDGRKEGNNSCLLLLWLLFIYHLAKNLSYLT